MPYYEYGRYQLVIPCSSYHGDIKSSIQPVTHYHHTYKSAKQCEYYLTCVLKAKSKYTDHVKVSTFQTVEDFANLSLDATDTSNPFWGSFSYFFGILLEIHSNSLEIRWKSFGNPSARSRNSKREFGRPQEGERVVLGDVVQLGRLVVEGDAEVGVGDVDLRSTTVVSTRENRSKRYARR